MMSDVAVMKHEVLSEEEGGILNGKKKEKESVTQKSHLMLTGLISLATISARFTSHQLRLSPCFHRFH